MSNPTNLPENSIKPWTIQYLQEGVVNTETIHDRNEAGIRFLELAEEIIEDQFLEGEAGSVTLTTPEGKRHIRVQAD